MTRARAWVTLCVVAAAVGSLTMSCGSDELTNGGKGGSTGTGGKGGLLGGSTGTGGARTGGAGGGTSGGSDGTGGTVSKSTNLGRACATNATCGTASGLSCVTDPVIPQGLCSATCETDADCQKISAGAVCNSGLCLEGCAIGPDALNKCHDRPDFACQFFDSVTTTTLCSVDEDCANSAVCNNGSCVDIITACQPTCASDDDCAGDFCNIGTGLCQATKPAGKAVGSACDVNATTDECAGMCIGDSAGTFSLCSGYCTFGVQGGCGWNGVGPAQAGCMFVPRYVQDLGAGDVGYCGQLCDCNDDCLNPTAKCLSFAALELEDFETFYGRKGYCGTAEPTDVVLDCGAGGDGAGGAGGAGSAGSPGAGAGGTSSGGSAGAGNSGGASGAGG